jgi:ribulose-5-phosphate 4-epimerase/fuculose-1-phosphate aldolase
MSDLDRIVRELVIANRILANENVVDAYGHVSHRHPDDPGRYLLARSVAPELVERDDIVEVTLDGLPTREEKRALYLERFIHGAIYEARPDVMAVVHAHAEAVLPFTVTKTPLRPVIHSGSFMGAEDRCGTSPIDLGTPISSSRTWLRAGTWCAASAATTWC